MIESAWFCALAVFQELADIAHLLTTNTTPCPLLSIYCLFLKGFIYLFLERGDGREKEQERNIIVWLLSRGLHWGLGPQPGHVP